MQKKQYVRRLVMVALFGALSFVLMLFKFNVPILSPFADFDFSALPELLGGFILGPVDAIAIIILKILLKLVFQGTNSMFTGEITNVILSVAYVLPAVLYYRKNRTKKGALIGIVIGTAASIVVAIFTNIFITFPFFMWLYGMSWDDILNTFSAINPWIKSIPTMVAFSVVPFNLVSRVVTSLITLLVYKRLSVPLKKFIQ